jgi:SAM-dependent methyltransferase
MEDPYRRQVAERWGDRDLTSTLAEIHWMGSAVVRRYLDRLASGNPGQDWLSALAERYLRGSGLRVLVLGCGEGWLERALARRPEIAAIDAADIAEEAVKRAADEARRQGLDHLSYQVLDLDRDPLPVARYDAVVAHATLHHVENLEHCFPALAATLRPGGVLLYNEYVGPRRFQFSDRQMEIINDLMVRLPARLRVSALQGWVYPHKERPTVEQMLAADPSESVRSDELLAFTRRHFEILEEIAYGGTLLQHLLYDVVQNFRPGDPWDDSLLELCCLLEERLIAGGALPPDYLIVAARPGASAGEPPGPSRRPPDQALRADPRSVARPPRRGRPPGLAELQPLLRRHGLGLPPVVAYLHRLATRHPGVPWQTWVLHELTPAQRQRVLLLGSWQTPLAAALAAGGTERIDCAPLGAPPGRPPAGVAGSAVAFDDLVPASYDAVFTQGIFGAALRYREALDRLAAALAPGGFWVGEDWVGPPDLSPPQRLGPLLAQLAALAPPGLLAERRVSGPAWLRPVARLAGRYRRKRAAERWRPWLPPEGALGEQLRDRFEILVERPYGGYLVDWVMARAAARLDPEEETQMAFVELLCYLEERLLRAGLLPPSWLCVLGRKR